MDPRGGHSSSWFWSCWQMSGFRWGFAVAMMVLLAGCSPTTVRPVDTSTAAPSAPVDASAPERQCADNVLRVTITSGGPGSASVISNITFTNVGTVVCELAGAPTVSVVKAGHEIGRPARRGGDSESATVLLEPGGAATATLTAVAVDPDGGRLGDACHLVYGTGYAVSPPHSYYPVLVPASEPVAACTGNTAWFLISSVRAQ